MKTFGITLALDGVSLGSTQTLKGSSTLLHGICMCSNNERLRSTIPKCVYKSDLEVNYSFPKTRARTLWSKLLPVAASVHSQSQEANCSAKPLVYLSESRDSAESPKPIAVRVSASAASIW